MGRRILFVAVASSVSAAACFFPSLSDLSGGDGDSAAEASDAAVDVDLGCVDAGDPSLEGYWRFDETAGTLARDCSGHGRDGTLITGGDVSWGPGKHGNALIVSLASFTGCVSVAGFPELTSFTIAAWVNPASFPTVNSTFAIDKSVNINAEGWRLGGSNTGGMVFGVGTDGGAFNNTTSTHPTLGTWTHIAATYDLTTATSAVYVDGSLDGSKSTPAFVPSTETLHIGCRADGSHTAYFDGMLDDVRIYSRILSPAEIQALAQ